MAAGFLDHLPKRLHIVLQPPSRALEGKLVDVAPMEYAVQETKLLLRQFVLLLSALSTTAVVAPMEFAVHLVKLRTCQPGLLSTL